MAAELLADLSRATDGNSSPLAGAKWYFYATGTTTPLSVYTTAALDVPHANPVVADSGGKFAPIYLNASLKYRGVLKSASDVTIQDIDPINASVITDLAESGGSALIGYNSGFTGAQDRTQFDRNKDQISLLDFIPPSQQAAILSRTSTYDCTADVQKFVDAISSQRRKGWIPGGLYKIVPATAFADEGSLGTKAAFLMRSYMDIEAEDGATFRIADGISTDAVPQSMAFFATNQVLTDISITGLTMDMNGANNPISPNRPVTRTGTISLTSASAAVVGVGTSFTTQAKAGWTILVAGLSYRVQSVTDNTHLTLTSNASSTLSGQAFVAGKFNDYNQSSVYVSGTPGGVAARIDNAVIRHCRFINNPGVSSVCLAQSNVLGVTLGGNWDITDNEFENNGSDSIDHSSVYGWANQVWFQRNWMSNDTQYSAQYGGGVAAYEVHGSHHWFTDNYIHNYYRGIWVSENYTSSDQDIFVHDNIFSNMKAGGVEFFGQVATTPQGRHSRVARNFISFDDTAHPGLDLKVGIAVTSIYAQGQIEINDNWVRASGTTVASAGVVVGASSVAAQKHGNIVISGNRAEATTFCVFMRATSINGFAALTLKNNKGFNLTAAGVYTTPIGIFADGSTSSIETLTIHDNDMIDDRAIPPASVAVYLQGTFGTIDYRRGAVLGSAITAYTESAITVTTRRGTFLTQTTYDPPSLAAGAKGTIQTLAYAGAALGQTVSTSFSIDSAGVRFPAWVSAAGTISYYAINENGANPLDLGSGTLRFTVVGN